MAETDILNPVKGFDKRINDSMNPNQGWQKDRAQSLAEAEPAFGAPWTRETSNKGRIFTLNWSLRNLAVIERLEQFYDQFEDEYFTLRDYDGGRDYVGRFFGGKPQSFVRNGRWTSQGWQFREIPGAPMLQYPDNFERWGITRRPFFPDGTPRVATNSANWTRPAAVADDFGVMRQPNQLQNLTPAAGDWCTFEYRGYGFRLWALQDVPYGQIEIVVDGINLGEVQLNAAANLGPAAVFTKTDLPLDLHRVQIIIPLGASTGVTTGMVLDRFEVMR